MCIGGKSFAWVYENRKEFVEFTVEKMDKPTKLFLKWKKYVLSRINIKQDDTSSGTGNRRRTGTPEEGYREN